eukprot:TRINITY_DN24092_c0_g1_i16.p1 TRINITY_DN24092_c0_g1~~TRINITY_DN24092_c0_g1_i16.p1  ORF type:complete len:109 (-),score=2.21 TRINITY_DN24092_c0_g1_i16:193-498(-)
MVINVQKKWKALWVECFDGLDEVGCCIIRDIGVQQFSALVDSCFAMNVNQIYKIQDLVIVYTKSYLRMLDLIVKLRIYKLFSEGEVSDCILNFMKLQLSRY